MRREAENQSEQYLPTLTAVRLSSSDALLPTPALLLILSLLELLGLGFTMALRGRSREIRGDAGGEESMMGSTAD